MNFHNVMNLSGFHNETDTLEASGSSIYTEERDEYIRPSTPLCLFASVCSIIFTVIGSVGNLITVIALSRCRRLRNATTAFVVSLAAADFLFCSVNLPLTAIRYAHQKWIFGDELCIIFPFLFYGNVAASLFFMMAITLNRLVLINYYHLYDKIFSHGNIILIIILCWGCSFGSLLPTLVGAWGRFGYREASFSCTILPSKDGTSPKKFLFITGFLLPVVTIIISYICIYYKVKKSEKELKKHEPTFHPKYLRRILNQKTKEMQVTRTMLIIFCGFLICFFPLMIVNVLEKYIRYPVIHVLASILAWMSSCTNPFVYVVMSHHYRQAYIRLFCPKRFVSSSQQSSRVTSIDSMRSGLSTERDKGNRLMLKSFVEQRKIKGNSTSV